MNEISAKIILQACKKQVQTVKELENIKRDILRVSKEKIDIPRKSKLLETYFILLKAKKIKQNLNLEKLLVKRGVRTLSGVAIITVLTKPWPCPGQCVYCPFEDKMPKSYLSSEPAAARALRLKFDPYEQVRRRIETLRHNGHPTDKMELIVKGGSWNAYPLIYQYEFIMRCFMAANGSPKSKVQSQKYSFKKLKEKLVKEQKKNETGKHRIIGLTLETRPDMINEKTLEEMRWQGCTRLELGVQSTNDKILKKIKRGHTIEATKRAIRLAKAVGFKVDFHLMPQLPGSTPASDLKMMLEIFSNPDYRPDMIKVYPCTVIKGSELYTWLKNGEYKTYSNEKLIAMLIKFKAKVPRYVRISRLIRDIPSPHIESGNKMTNLRQVVQAEMKKRGLSCNCLRCREVGHQIEAKNKNEKLKMFVDKYEASGGTEYFLSWEDKNRKVVYAFCRLRLEHNFDTIKKEFKKIKIYPAYIRELHTYGQLLDIGTRDKKASQHQGMGKKLIIEAEKIVKKNKIDKLAVISGVGVRGYYRKLGYKLENGYMVLRIIKDNCE